MLSSDLRWSHHMNKTILEGSKRAGLLRLIARDLPSSVIIKLYLYYLRPSLEHASPCWHSSIFSSHAMALELIQASVARCVFRAIWMTAKPALLAKFDWPSLRWRRDIPAVSLLHSLLRDRREPF